MAVTTGLTLLATHGVRSTTIRIIGDDKSSLAWCKHEFFHNTLSRSASMAFMALVTICDLQIGDAVHIPGERNIVPDRLSRGVSYEALHLDPAVCVCLADVPLVTAIVTARNPRNDNSRTTDTEFYPQWGFIADLVRQLVNPELPTSA